MRRLLCAAALVLSAAPSYADADVRVSPGVWLACGGRGCPGLGGDVVWPLRMLRRRLALSTGFTYYLASAPDPSIPAGAPRDTMRRTFWQLHADLVREIRLHGACPYLGGGMGHERRETPASDLYGRKITTITARSYLRAVAGSTFPSGPVAPFVQLAVNAQNSPELVFSGCVRF